MKADRVTAVQGHQRNLGHQRMHKSGFILLLIFLIQSCSMPAKLMNLVNIPLSIQHLVKLDSLKIQPERVSYAGTEETRFRNFDQDIRIQGDHLNRPTWKSDSSGCFRVTAGNTVHMLDFNFKGGANSEPLISVDSGTVILENCDLDRSSTWALRVGPYGRLELRNVKLRDHALGGVLLEGGEVRIFDAHLSGEGGQGIFASSGRYFEAHRMALEDGIVDGITLNTVREVWLDSVRIEKMKRDALILNDCDFTFISASAFLENDRFGLAAAGGRVLGVLNSKLLGNKISGAEISGLDSLRIVASSFTANQTHGLSAGDIKHSRLVNLNLSSNGQTGLQWQRGSFLELHQSRIQGNPEVGARIDSVNIMDISDLQVVNNGTGLQVNHYDQLQFSTALIAANRNAGLDLLSGSRTTIEGLHFEENLCGLRAQDLQDLVLSKSVLFGNELGLDLSSIVNMTSSNNAFKHNSVGASLRACTSVSSSGDVWRSSRDTGIDASMTDALLFNNSSFLGNRNGIILNQTRSRFEQCKADSSTEVCILANNSRVYAEESSFQHNGTTFKLGEGSSLKLIRSDLHHNSTLLHASGAADISIGYSTLTSSRHAFQLGDYSNFVMLASQASSIDGYLVTSLGGDLIDVHLRQNIISNSGGIISTQATGGDIVLENNTFAGLLSAFKLDRSDLMDVQKNIFFDVPMDIKQMIRGSKTLNDNCFYPLSTEDSLLIEDGSNMSLNPQFDLDFFLKADSPCLSYGPDAVLIGARGVANVKQPVLAP